MSFLEWCKKNSYPRSRQVLRDENPDCTVETIENMWNNILDEYDSYLKGVSVVITPKSFGEHLKKG